MNQHIEYALAHPVYDPKTQLTPGHFWYVERGVVRAGLSANIGVE